MDGRQKPASETERRLGQLTEIEDNIISSLQHASDALHELSKDKISNSKSADKHVQDFMKTLKAVENDLSNHILYLTQVSTGQSHEGSSYASQKALQMAWHRLEHIRTRVKELERIKNQHAHPAQRSIQQPQT